MSERSDVSTLDQMLEHVLHPALVPLLGTLCYRRPRVCLPRRLALDIASKKTRLPLRIVCDSGHQFLVDRPAVAAGDNPDVRRMESLDTDIPVPGTGGQAPKSQGQADYLPDLQIR
jgi:hypothetical protein